MSYHPVPRPTRLNRARQRLYIRLRDRRDRRHQSNLGLDTFEADWQRLFQTQTATANRLRNRTVWILWFQGLADAPPMIQKCIQSWRSQNPGWTVQVLDEHNLGQFVDTSQYNDRHSLTHLSDLIRLDLLARHGGVWADATTVCLRPLDDWIDRTQDYGFFAFSRPQPLRALASWFLAASPGSSLLLAMQLWCRLYLDGRRSPRSYFFFHHTFDWLLEIDPSLREIWTRCPQISARGPHIIQRILDGHLAPSDQPEPTTMATLPMFKLNRKKNYRVEDIDAVMAEHGLTTLSGLAAAPSASSGLAHP